jgi:hypothetical protein
MLLRGAKHGVGVFERMSQGFFQDHVFACLGCGYYDWPVEVVRNTDHDRVNILPLDELSIIGFDGGDFPLPREGFSVSPVRGARRDQLRVRDFLKRSGVEVLGEGLTDDAH